MIIKFVKNFLIIILVTISLIISIEFLFFTLHNITGSKYFESNFELRKRYNVVRPYDEPNFISELNSNKIKVAIFGGSSSYGHGTQINFGEFLENLSSNKYLIHNFAKNGAPFVDFQSDILQLVSPYYDILIIYAGHNEIWSHLYSKSYLLNQNIELFNGHIVNGSKIRFEHNLEISLLKKIIQSQNEMYFWILNSRLLSLYKKVIIFMKNKIKSTNQNKNVKELRYPLFVNKAVISEVIKKKCHQIFSKN